MALFDKQPEIPRSQFRDILKKSDIRIGQSKPLSENKKSLIEKKDFPKRFGETINRQEYDRTIRRLRSEKIAETDFAKKSRLGKELKFLQELEKKDNTPK
jgi:hypothetical protein